MSLKAEAVSVRVAGRTLIEDITLALAPGGMTAVVGPNGAGKSTLLKTLSGDLAPSAGTVSMDGRRLGNWRARERACRRAVLPQESSLDFPFTVQEVVLMGRSPHRSTPTCDHAITAETMVVAGVAGVAHLAARRYPSLSGGERQRVHLARVLAQLWVAAGEPPGAARYLLLDEPTASLDLAHQHTALAVARRCASQGMGVLAILHDLHLAALYADHIVVLHEGRILTQGAPWKVLHPAVIDAAFEIDASVIPHPLCDRPLVIAAPRWAGARTFRPRGVRT